MFTWQGSQVAVHLLVFFLKARQELTAVSDVGRKLSRLRVPIGSFAVQSLNLRSEFVGPTDFESHSFSLNAPDDGSMRRGL